MVEPRVKKVRRVFYGTSSTNVCAFCWKHHLYLTPNQVKVRRCLKRKCARLQKFQHPVWKNKAGGKEVISRKERIEKMYEEHLRQAEKRKQLGIHS